MPDTAPRWRLDDGSALRDVRVQRCNSRYKGHFNPRTP